ncbi:uncharacterized protein ACIBXB_012163 isoform 1-T1 [Morphnus guianensis]
MKCPSSRSERKSLQRRMFATDMEIGEGYYQWILFTVRIRQCILGVILAPQEMRSCQEMQPWMKVETGNDLPTAPVRPCYNSSNCFSRSHPGACEDNTLMLQITNH